MRAATRRDVAWAVFVALLLAASPVTGAHRVIPALVLGALGGCVVLLLRLRRRREGWTPPGPAIARPGPWVAAVLLGALVLFAPTLHWLWEEYTKSIWRTPHGLFVPFFAALLARHRLRDDPDPHPESSLWGLALLLPGCALVVFDAGIRSHYLSLLALALTGVGLLLLLLGARRTRALAFPLALCLFGVPLPNGLGDPMLLPTLSAEVGRSLVELLGLPATRFGSQLEAAGGLRLEVSQNCSGLSFFYGGCALAFLCLGATRSWPQRLALVVAPYALSVLGNGVRVAFVLMAGSRFGLDWKFHTPIHGLVGTAVFLGVVTGVWLVSDRRALRESLS